MFTAPNPIAFNIYSIDIHWYGIIISISMLIGLFVVCKIRDKFFKEISTDTICDLSFYLIIFGLIFARLYYVILDYPYFLRHPYEIPAIWNGGIAIQGAIIGGIMGGYIYARNHNLNFLRLADLFVFGAITGQIIGRWGNFFNSEAFGLPTNLPWKLYIPFQYRPIEFRNYEFFHPTFLYESILNIFVLIILYFILKRKRAENTNGIIFFAYLTFYSIVRMIVETLRVDSILNIGIIHVAHIASIVIFIIGAIGLYKISRK